MRADSTWAGAARASLASSNDDASGVPSASQHIATSALDSVASSEAIANASAATPATAPVTQAETIARASSSRGSDPAKSASRETRDDRSFSEKSPSPPSFSFDIKRFSNVIAADEPLFAPAFATVAATAAPFFSRSRSALRSLAASWRSRSRSRAEPARICASRPSAAARASGDAGRC